MPDTQTPSPDPPPRNARLVLTALTISIAIFILIATDLDRTLLQIHFSLNWPAWINPIEAFTNSWLYQIVLISTIALCLLIDPALRRSTILAMPAQFIAVHALKFLVGRVRPINGGDPRLFEQFSTVGQAYPSGHATTLFTLYFLIAQRFPKTRIIALLPVAYFCWFRIHNAAHFGSDLLAGAVLGYGLATSARLLGSKFQRPAPSSLNPCAPATAALLTILIPAMAVAAMMNSAQPHPSQTQASSIVQSLYTTYLDREPDAPGQKAYADRLAKGVPTIALVREIITSDESRQRLRAILTTRERVTDIYINLLGRPPTDDELDRVSPLVEDLSRNHGRLFLLVFRLTLSKHDPY